MGHDPAFTNIPFQNWVTEGPKEQFRWKIRISSPELSPHQRLATTIQIQVDGKEFAKRCCEGNGVALVQIKDLQGRVYQTSGVRELRDMKAGAEHYNVDFSWIAFVLPGKYEVALAMFFKGGAEYNFATRELNVGRLKSDPLVDSWKGLPNVEFTDPLEGGVNDFLLPEISGLYLPVATRRPVRMDVLVNLTPYTTELSYPPLYREKLAVLLPVLKIFGQLNLANGFLNVATLDLSLNRMTFQQDAITSGNLDLPGLKDALTAADHHKIDFHDLGRVEPDGVLLSEELNRRLNRGNGPADRQGQPPLRIVILVSSSLTFDGKGPSPIEPPEDHDFIVYYMNVQYGEGQAYDQIEKVLKKLKPRIYSVSSPEDTRKTLAKILADISQL